MKKRVIGLAMALMLMLMSFSVCVSAAPADVTVTVGSVSGKAGDIVEIPVSISEGSYLVNLDIEMTYDATVLEPVFTQYADPDDESLTTCYQVNGELFGNGWMYVGAVKKAGCFRFSAATASSTGKADGGELIRVAFKILKSTVGTNIDVNVYPICGNDGTGAADADGYPQDYALNCTVVNGKVVAEPDGLIGDMNNDGVLNTVDALLHYACVNGARAFTDAQFELADYNRNGTIDMMDTLLLFKHVSGF